MIKARGLNYSSSGLATTNRRDFFYQRGNSMVCLVLFPDKHLPIRRPRRIDDSAHIQDGPDRHVAIRIALP